MQKLKHNSNKQGMRRRFTIRATSIMDFIVKQSNYPSNTAISCRSNATGGADADEYAVSATLTGGSSGALPNADNWCVDSTGFSNAIADPLNNNDTTCQ